MEKRIIMIYLVYTFNKELMKSELHLETTSISEAFKLEAELLEKGELAFIDNTNEAN